MRLLAVLASVPVRSVFRENVLETTVLGLEQWPKSSQFLDRRAMKTELKDPIERLLQLDPPSKVPFRHYAAKRLEPGVGRNGRASGRVQLRQGHRDVKKTGWAVVVIGLGVVTGLVLSKKPWAEYQEQKTLLRDANTDMKKAETERADLLSQEARNQNPSGRERSARLRGYHKPGEVPAEDVR